MTDSTYMGKGKTAPDFDAGNRALNDMQIREVIADGARYDLNRQLSDRITAKLDPDGTHILSLMLYGHNMDWDTTRPLHHRAYALLKLKDRGPDDPYTLMLDITDQRWRSLPSAESLREADEKE